MNQLKNQVEQLAKEEGKPAIEIITALQAAAAELDDKPLLDQLCKLKRTYIYANSR